jgi:hypothetical protein
MGSPRLLTTVTNDPGMFGQIPDFCLASHDHDGFAAPDAWHNDVAHESARESDGL